MTDNQYPAENQHPKPVCDGKLSDFDLKKLGQSLHQFYPLEPIPPRFQELLAKLDQ